MLKIQGGKLQEPVAFREASISSLTSMYLTFQMENQIRRWNRWKLQSPSDKFLIPGLSLCILNTTQ